MRYDFLVFWKRVMLQRPFGDDAENQDTAISQCMIDSFQRLLLRWTPYNMGPTGDAFETMCHNMWTAEQVAATMPNAHGDIVRTGRLEGVTPLEIEAGTQRLRLFCEHINNTAFNGAKNLQFDANWDASLISVQVVDIEDWEYASHSDASSSQTAPRGETSQEEPYPDDQASAPYFGG